MPKNNKKPRATIRTPTPKAPTMPKQQVRDTVISVLKTLPKGSLADAGSTIGGFVAGPAGSLAGRGLGQVLSRITGHGSYTMQNGIKLEGSPPSFARQGEKVILCHREYLGSVTSPGTGFFNTPYTINPGDPVTFPWLASVARNFQRYRFRGLVFEYKSKSTDYAAGSSLGTVSIGTNYNSFDLPWTTFQQVQNASFTVDGKPSDSFYHLVECSRSLGGQSVLFVRDGVNTVSSPQLYDVGLLQVCTNGITAAVGTEVGSLWCSYEIELMEPILGLSGNVVAGGAWTTNTIYSAATGGFAQGPLLSNTTDGASWLANTATNVLSTNGVPMSTVVRRTTSVPTPANFPTGCCLLIDVGSITRSSTSGSVTYYFNRNGTYLINYNIGTTTGAAVINTPWTFSGDGATALIYNNANTQSTTTACGMIVIRVVGSNAGAVSSIIVTANTTQTFTQTQPTFAIC